MSKLGFDSVWAHMTEVTYDLADKRGLEKMKYRYVDEIARSLLEHYPNSAHLHALERIHTVGELQTDMWRQVLEALDKLEAKNDGGTLATDRDGRESESSDIQQKLGSENDQDTWGQGSPDGVDELEPR